MKTNSESSHALVKISQARRAIAEAKSIDEVKDIRDKAEAVRVYAKQSGLSQDIVNDAAEIKIRAEYRAGQLLKEMEKNKGAVAGGKKDGPRGHIVLPRDTSPTLSALGVSKNESSRWQMLATIPEEEFEAKLHDERVAVRELTTNGMMKAVIKSNREAARKELAQSAKAAPLSEKFEIYCGDITDWNAPRMYDYIITDPPYKKEFLPLYSVLGQRAAEWLKPGGLLIALSAHYYLPELCQRLGAHLDYFWTAAYLVRGESAGVFQRHIIPQWKPVLIYQNPGPLSARQFADVFESPANDKSHHKWGQSVGGMSDVVKKICEPGSFILDPFCGAGTTGVAAIENACFFHGLDIDGQNCDISRARLSEAEHGRMA